MEPAFGQAAPTDAMVAAGITVSGARATQVRTVFRVMLAASVKPAHRTQ